MTTQQHAAPIVIADLAAALAGSVADRSTLPPAINFVTADIKDFSYEVDKEDGVKTAYVSVNGESFEGTPRFRESFLGLIGQSESVFNLFTPKEVFDRAAQHGMKEVRLAYAPNDKGVMTALAMTNPSRPILNSEEILDSLADSPFFTGYRNGIFSMHIKPQVANQMMIAGDKHDPFFNLDVPLDGYGSPNSYLAMLRQVCSNGAVAMDKAFKTTVQFGKGEDPLHTLGRFIKSFYDEDGYADLRDKLDLAARTPASMAELRKINNMLVKDASVSMNVLGRFSRIVGDTMSKYGIATMESIGEKRATMLPTDISVYSLINMATEVATHIALPTLRHQLNGAIGSFMSLTYDLEGLKDYDLEKDDRQALYFVGQPKTNEPSELVMPA